MAKTNYPDTELSNHRHSHILCWKSVFAGVFISIMSFMILAALGASILGAATQNAIEKEAGGSALATGAGLWLGLSAVISLFMGSYFAMRISQHIGNKIGAAHGFVVASIFFILLMIQATSTIGSLSIGLSRLVGGLSSGATNVATSPMVQDTINRALGSANLKGDPKVVAEGLVVRLMQGDVESAKAYYSYQTGLSGAELDTKIAQLKADFEVAAKTAGDRAAEVVKDTGLSLFVTFIVGLMAALIGGRTGAHANSDRPLTMEAAVTPIVPTGGVLASQRGSVLPYVFGWLLGVPTSILFLIFIFRSVF